MDIEKRTFKDKTCPQCQREKAIIHSEYGVLPGKNCQKENERIPKPSQKQTYDFASPVTKLQRKQYAKDMLQPFHDGVLSKEFVEAHGTDRLAGVTKKDTKNAKYVYNGMTRHHKIK